jgi:beta-alanine--pyruvate transaminase
MAKAINNATVPMGAVAVGNGIHETIVNAAPEGTIEFMHGYTYSGHPLAAAAVVATQKLYREEHLFQRAALLSPYFEEAVHSLRGTRHVIDIRNLELIAGIELEPRPGAPGRRGYEAFVKCFEWGVLVRVTGDILALSPPLIIEKPHIDKIVETIRDALKTVD